MQKDKALDLPKLFPGDLEIDFMDPSDLEEVMEIERLSFVFPWPVSQFLHELRENPVSHAFILKKKQRESCSLIGFSICWIVAHQIHIANVAIHPAYRRRGYGEALLRFLLRFGMENHCRKATLEVRVSNQPAIEMYKKLGFHIAGVAREYYEANKEDAYIFVKPTLP